MSGNDDYNALPLETCRKIDLLVFNIEVLRLRDSTRFPLIEAELARLNPKNLEERVDGLRKIIREDLARKEPVYIKFADDGTINGLIGMTNALQTKIMTGPQENLGDMKTLINLLGNLPYPNPNGIQVRNTGSSKPDASRKPKDKPGGQQDHSR